MSTRSSRGRSPMRSPDRNPVKSPRAHDRSRSYSRSATPDRHRRTRSRSHSISRDRSPSRSASGSRSPARGGRRYRSTSYSRSPSPVQSPPRSSKVVVEKLTKNVTEAHLREIFGSFGDIEYIDLPMNRSFMTNRGTAYILYYDPADAEAAIAHMHEAQLDGAVLNVSIVLPRRNFSRSPPPASNRGPGGRARFGKRTRGDSPPRRHGRARPGDRRDTYRPPSVSRSRSPVRPRSYSRSRSPPRRGSRRADSPRSRRRRSPSYSSYSYSSRSRSRSPVRSRSRTRR
ncbi:hypothetical protein PDE_05804 [Penicillium oxalicum 114-2]|uniref:RRM domain-containing protein n=1 Tax=Penicillium oxalicum (strain 114-2 / CGMCC 5302) TaxID=933388 RepID=S8B821_PENO1|nr:hypothetical protein PDE_05804 [Penicillium oxalicum 114-2]